MWKIPKYQEVVEVGNGESAEVAELWGQFQALGLQL